MSLSAATVWEVRTSGSDANGGGFVAGSGGTDYSQQDAAQASGTASSSGTTVTATTGIFTSAMVGNLVTDGTTWKQIVTFVSATQITVDSAPSWTSASVKVGGALATVDKAAALVVAQNIVFVKSGTYTTATGATLNPAAATLSNTVMPTRLVGYYQTRGDIHQQSDWSFSNNTNRPVLQITNGNSGITVLTIGSTPAAVQVENFIIDCNSQITSTGLEVSGGSNSQHNVVLNVLVKNFKSAGFECTGGTTNLLYGEATAGVSGATAAVRNTGNAIFQCYFCNVHDNGCKGVDDAAGCFMVFCLIANNVGNGLGPAGTYTANCTFWNNSGDGIHPDGTFWMTTNWLNNIIAGSGGYGINSTIPVPAVPWHDGNAFWNNTLGNRNNWDDTTANAQNGVSPYINTRDVACSVNPFRRATVPAADLVVDSVNNLKVTSGGYLFMDSDVGSSIYVTNQTGGWTMGSYAIGSVSGGAAVLTSSPGVTGSSSGNWYFNDFRLNNAVGGGALLRGTAVAARPGGLLSYRDFGAFQHADGE